MDRVVLKVRKLLLYEYPVVDGVFVGVLSEATLHMKKGVSEAVRQREHCSKGVSLAIGVRILL